VHYVSGQFIAPSLVPTLSEVVPRGDELALAAAPDDRELGPAELRLGA